MTEEIWKPIPGFLDYEVSDLGRVQSLKRNGIRILKPAHDKKTGYLGVNLSNQNKKRFTRIQSLVTLAFIGPCPDGLEICHGPGGPSDNHLDNLRYDTHLANMKDRTLHGRKGKLTTEQIRQLKLKARELRNKTIIGIRTEYAVGDITLSKLAEKYNLTKSAISRIIRGINYKDVDGPIVARCYTGKYKWDDIKPN